MNHGGLGFIDTDGIISIPPEFIEHLCLHERSILYSMYYPPDRRLEEYKDVTIDHDFVITPIPFKWWGRSARLVLNIHQTPGSLSDILNVLTRANACILHSESTRSAHRYATYSLHIAFAELPDSRNDYKEVGEFYQKTQDALDALLEELAQCPSIFINADSVDHSRGNSIYGHVNSELAYFDYIFHEDKEKGPAYRQFELKVKADTFAYNLSAAELSAFIADESYCAVQNSAVFIEFDSRALNMRVAVIPKEKKNFFELGIRYNKLQNSNPGSIGVINEIINALPKTYNIYRSYNFSINNEKDGTLILLIENTDNDIEDYYKDVKLQIDRLYNKTFRTTGIKISKALLSSVTALKVSIRLKKLVSRTHYKSDIFISVSSQDEQEGRALCEQLKREGISPYLYVIDNTIGEDFSKSLREHLLNSREMCVLLSRHAMKSQWVTTEWGAAWFLGKNITPIWIGGFKPDTVTDVRLKMQQGFQWGDKDGLAKFINAIRERRGEQELQEFDEVFGR